jgi:hypothetical protein
MLRAPEGRGREALKREGLLHSRLYGGPFQPGQKYSLSEASVGVFVAFEHKGGNAPGPAQKPLSVDNLRLRHKSFFR